MAFKAGRVAVVNETVVKFPGQRVSRVPLHLKPAYKPSAHVPRALVVKV